MLPPKGPLPLAIGLFGAFALFAPTWSACTLPSVEQPIARTYVLVPEGPRGRPAQGRDGSGESRGVLLVSAPQASAGYDTARMIYLRRPQEVNYYAASQWADTPARMLHPLLVEALASTGAFDAVVQMPSVARGDFRLDTESVIVEQRFFDLPSQVHLSARMRLIDLQDLTVVATRHFEIVEKSPTEDAYGGVIAANDAARRLLDEVGEWLASRMARIRRGGG
jgi:cholesterol transport system auxiliary component